MAKEIKLEGSVIVTLDASNPDYLNQAPLVAEALKTIINGETGLSWAVSQERTRRSGKNSPSSMVQFNLRQPASTKAGVEGNFEDQARQSNTNILLSREAYILSLLSARIVDIRAQQGETVVSSVFEVYHTVAKGVEVEAPGLVRTGKPGGAGVDLLIQPISGNEFDLVVASDLADGATAGATFTQNFIYDSGADPNAGWLDGVAANFVISEIGGEGAWTIATNDSFFDDGATELVVDTTMDADTATTVVSKDGTPVATNRINLNGGVYTQPEKLGSAVRMWQDDGGDRYLISESTYQSDLGGNMLGGYQDQLFDGLGAYLPNVRLSVRNSASMSINNDTGATIPAGTSVAKFFIPSLV